jgi:hypothetical protein
MQILRRIKSWYGRGNSAWDGNNGLDADLVHIDNHLPNITYAGAVAAGTASSASPAAVPGRAQLFVDGTYAVTNRTISGTLAVTAYTAIAGALASDGLTVLINTGSGWVNPFTTLPTGSIPLSALAAGALPSTISIDGVQVFTSIPASNVGDVIIVRTPHTRQMVWNGVAYVRAPWHQPGMVQYSIDNPASIPGYLPVRGDVVYAQANYPDLVARLGLSGTGNFSLLDLRGVFIRCLDNGRIVDNGRVHASFQGDAIRNITGTFGEVPNVFSVTTNGAFTRVPKNVSNLSSGVSAGTADYQFNASLVVPTASENRPINTALPAWVSY